MDDDCKTFTKWAELAARIWLNWRRLKASTSAKDPQRGFCHRLNRDLMGQLGLAHPPDILVNKAIKTDAMPPVELLPGLRGGLRLHDRPQAVKNNADQFSLEHRRILVTPSNARTPATAAPDYTS